MITRMTGLLVVALAVSGCTSASAPTNAPQGGQGSAPAATVIPATPSAPATSTAPAPSATTSGSERALIEFAVDEERYRVLLVDPAQIALARQMLAGSLPPMIPNGRVVRAPDAANPGYSWHIDPLDFAFADVTTEVCDGLPSDVEAGTVSGDRFCPWSARVFAIDPQP